MEVDSGEGSRTRDLGRDWRSRPIAWVGNTRVDPRDGWSDFSPSAWPLIHCALSEAQSPLDAAIPRRDDSSGQLHATCPLF